MEFIIINFEENNRLNGRIQFWHPDLLCTVMCLCQQFFLFNLMFDDVLIKLQNLILS